MKNTNKSRVYINFFTIHVLVAFDPAIKLFTNPFIIIKIMFTKLGDSIIKKTAFTAQPYTKSEHEYNTKTVQLLSRGCR